MLKMIKIIVYMLCKYVNKDFKKIAFETLIAHLSQRFIGELIGYPWSVVVVLRRPSVHNFKRLLFCNRLANQSQRFIVELIGYPWSASSSFVVHPSTISNVFFSVTAWPFKAKFFVEPPWEGGTKVYINGLGHMTKMAAMPIYGKNFKKSSSPELEVLWSWNLACSIGDSSSTKFI